MQLAKPGPGSDDAAQGSSDACLTPHQGQASPDPGPRPRRGDPAGEVAISAEDDTLPEQQAAPRTELHVPVSYGGAAAGVGFAVNLSTSGVLLERVSAPAEPGAAVWLRFSCCLGSFETEVCGKVARGTADGFAVHFDALDALQQRFVQDLLACSAPLRASAIAALV